MSKSLKDIPVKVETKPGSTVSLYASSKKIYQRDVRGLFANCHG